MEKKLLSYLPFHFLLALILGIYLQFSFKIWQFGFVKLAVTGIVLLLILALFHKFSKKVFFGFSTLLFFVFVGISSVYIQDNRNYSNYYKHFTDEDFSVVLTIDKVLKPGNYYNKYEAEVVQINQQKTVGRVLLNIQRDSVSKLLKVDENIFLKPKFKNLIPPLNPHQFSYQDYLAKRGIYNQVFIEESQYKKLKNTRSSLVGLAAKFREKVQQSLQEYHFSKNEYAVINALLLGQRQDISKELLQDYSRAGAIHILAVSGLHVGIILLLLNQLFQPLEKTKKSRILKAFLIVLLLWMFAFIAGLSASVVRAVTMFTFVAVGQIFQRKRIVEHSLIASMFFLLLIKPMFLFDVGFQLSYLAVFGIVWVQPLLYQIWQPKLKFIDKFWQLFTVSIAAQAGILPISLYYFHQFPSLFVLSNLVIIPFLGAILLVGIVVIILSLLKILPQFLADAYGFVIAKMNNFVTWISHQEDFLFRDISMSFLKMLFWYVVIFFGIRFFVKKSPKSLIYGLISIVFVQLFYVLGDFQKNKKQEFIVFHKSRKAVLGERKGNSVTFYSDVDSVKLKQEKLAVSYNVGENIQSKFTNKIPNVFQFKNQQIIRIDSLGAYKISDLQKPIVLLQYSPKINLKRLIAELKPIQIIADGTNYKSYVNRWEATCIKEKTPFHYTGQNGAFKLEN